MRIWGRALSRRELEMYSGRLEQLAGIRLAELADGRERGVRVADVRTGGGLSFTVLLDRGMDIGAAEYCGVPLAFQAPPDAAAPAYFNDRGINWLRTWGAGLMTGCGLRNVGTPGATPLEDLPLHGRLSHQPARRVNTGELWDGDECTLYVEGEMSESRLFGENLRLRRRILARMGGSEIVVQDTVENLGFEPEPVFMLYHTNWGFPLINESTTIAAAEHPVEPRDEVASQGVADWMRMQAPTPGYREQVFYHDVPATGDGFSTIALRSPATGLVATVSCRKAELPVVVHWKMMGQGAYVTGIEPSNCRVGGREQEMQRGPHCVLGPGTRQRFEVRIAVNTLSR